MPKPPLESTQREPLEEEYLSKNVTMRGIGPDNPLSFLARLQQLGMDAEGGDTKAQTAFLERALRYSAEIDRDTEKSPAGVVLAFLRKPLQHLLDNAKVKADAFGIPLKRGRPRLEKTAQNRKDMAKRVAQYKALGATPSEAKGKTAGDSRDVRTVERAYKEFRPLADATEMVERYYKKK